MDVFQEIMKQQEAKFAAERERLANRTPEQIAADDARQAQHERAEQEVVARRRSAALAALFPEKYRWARADAPELAERVEMPDAARWAKHPPSAPFVLLSAPAGAGKTSLAVAAMQTAILDQRVRLSRCFFVTAYRLGIARIQARAGSGEPELVERAMSCEWLILDGLGETASDAPSSAVPDVVFERHSRELTTWITTGLHTKPIGERWGGGFLRRIVDGEVVRFGVWPDATKQIALPGA